MMRLANILSGAAALVLLSAMPVAAAVPTLAVNIDNTGATGGSGPNIMIGWRFTTTDPIRVSQLGFWDDAGDGFAETHPVGIWTTAGSGSAAAALVTGTLSAGTANPLAPGSWFRMVDVTPIDLPAGDYVIGGLLPGNQVDGYKDVSVGVTGFTSAPGITWVERRLPGFAGFGRPDGVSPGPGEFGPNFTFTVLPEPSTAALLLCGVAGVVTRRGRRQS